MNPVYTLGHSTRELEELLALLRAHEVDELVDVRRFPASRRHPWFDREPLSEAVEAAGMEYSHREVLGGRRAPPDPESPNRGWRNEGFRAYADHLATPGAREALARLAAGAERRVQAVMCAEIVPWRCHRRIIADHLVASGVPVLHVIEPGDVQEHELNPMARVLDDGRIVYPEEAPEQRELFGGGDGSGERPGDVGR